MKLTSKKLIILLLHAPESNHPSQFNIPIQGRTRLMKTVFIFKEELLSDFQKDHTFSEIEMPEFFAWKYGPFSRVLLNDLEFLVNQNYVVADTGFIPIPEEFEEYKYWIEDTERYAPNEYSEAKYYLSAEKGEEKAKEYWKVLSNNQMHYLIELKTVFNKASLSRILEYVYKKYSKTGYIDKSIIRDKYLLH